METDIEEKKRFEENIEYLMNKICRDVKSIYKSKNVMFNDNDVHIKACEILSYLFNKTDEEYNWNFDVVYDSMEELYENCH